MVSIASLWLPILVSAVFVFIASSIIHMVLGYHQADYKKVPNEDEFMAALKKLEIPPGDYLTPCPTSRQAFKDPAFQEKMKAGPRLMMTIMPGGEISMGPQFVQWFLFAVLVGITSAYIAGRACAPGTHYLQVFRFAGATAFYGYSLALIPMSIWYRKSWGITIRGMIDGLIYGLLTGGVFGWLWPR